MSKHRILRRNRHIVGANCVRPEISPIANMKYGRTQFAPTITTDILTEILIALAEYYHASIDYLLGQTDVKTPFPCKKHTLKEK